jgi:hypothetical protein
MTEDQVRLSAPEREQVNRILASKEFGKTEMGRRILSYLAAKGSEGATEKQVAADVYKIALFRPYEDPRVRTQIGEVRKSLAAYHKGQGSRDLLVVTIGTRPYRLVFDVQRAAESIPGPDSDSGHGTGSGTPMGVVIWCSAVAAVALVVVLWLFYHRACGSYIAITDPDAKGEVKSKYLVQTTRTTERWFCACRDYLIVQPASYDQWWVQEQLANGDHPSVMAQFGDYSTPAGTQFSVFILTTQADLKPGELNRSSPLRGEAQSPALVVTLKK